MLFSAKIPDKLNISIIKPILKDSSKNTDDLNNMYEKLFQLKQQVCDLLSKFLNGQIEQEMVKFFKK